MSKKDEALKLAQDLRALADRFSEGWHDGIKIDASDIVLLSDAAEALAEPEPRNQCAETCERAKLCAICAMGLEMSHPPASKPLTDEQIWKNDQIMSLNADLGWHMDTIRMFARAIEAAHGITGEQK